MDEILHTLKTIDETPFLYPFVHKEVRRALIHKFPFGVYYQTIEQSIVVLAVMHGSRNPTSVGKESVITALGRASIYIFLIRAANRDELPYTDSTLFFCGLYITKLPLYT